MRRLFSFLGVTVLCAGMLSVIDLPPAQATTQTFVFTGAPQMYVVPDGVTSIAVTLSGAQGNSPSGGGTGGLGGRVSATISVNPGEVLQLMVGGGTYNGGANGAGSGGGATDIRRPSFSTSSSCAFDFDCTLSQRIIVAGGGGGGGSFAGAVGGAGGQSASAGTTANTGVGDSTGGGGGTSSAGGSLGAGTFTTSGAGAGAGTFGNGGASAWVAGAVGGGGGGGYFGGGGGGVSQDQGGTPQADGASGGGGGSSWAGGIGVSAPSFSDGVNSGAGAITIDPPSAIANAAFGFTGAPQAYTVPSGVSSIFMRLYGGAGVGGTAGDVVYGQLPVVANEVLQVNIGGRGWGSNPDTGFTPGQGGWNGGARGYLGAYSTGGGGGGASDVRRCASSSQGSCATSDRLVVAGGGGGASYGGWGLSGGTGGGGSDGSGSSGGNGGGLGASLTAPGGSVGGAAAAGAGADGGEGAQVASNQGSGGGGGGYFGGGGGNSNGGGGGSSYASVTGAGIGGLGNVLGPVTAPFRHSQGGSYGDGLAVITAMPNGDTGSSSDITSSSVWVSGAINPQYLASTPTVQYSTSLATLESGGGSSTNLADPTGSTVLAGSIPQAVAGSITGLSSGISGTTYYYRVCAQSVAGSGCGATDTFTTLPQGTTAPTVSAPTASGLSTSGASGSSSVNPGGNSVTVFFECSTSNSFVSIASSSAADESPLSGSSNQSVSGACSGLSQGTAYYMRVRVTMTIGQQTYNYYSSSASFSTTTPSPSPSPSPSSSPSQSGGGSTPAPMPTPTPTPTPTATSTPTVLPTPLGTVMPTGPLAPALPGSNPAIPATGLPLGTSVMLVNGEVQPVTVQPRVVEGSGGTSEETGLTMTGPGFSMTLAGLGASGRPLGLTPDGALVLEADRRAAVEGAGFQPNTDVNLYLFSEPRYLGTVKTRADGSFDGSVPLPLDVPAGRHTLQSNGFTPDGAVRSLSLGVQLNEPTVAGPVKDKKRIATARVYFAASSSKLDASAQRTLNQLLKKIPTKAKMVKVVGYVQGSGSTWNDKSLSTQRARTVAAYLRDGGLKGKYEVNGLGVAEDTGAKARRVQVTVTYRIA